MIYLTAALIIFESGFLISIQWVQRKSIRIMAIVLVSFFFFVILCGLGWFSKLTEDLVIGNYHNGITSILYSLNETAEADDFDLLKDKLHYLVNLPEWEYKHNNPLTIRQVQADGLAGAGITLGSFGDPNFSYTHNGKAILRNGIYVIKRDVLEK